MSQDGGPGRPGEVGSLWKVIFDDLVATSTATTPAPVWGGPAWGGTTLARVKTPEQKARARKRAERRIEKMKVPKEDVVSMDPLTLDPAKYTKVQKRLRSAPRCGSEGGLDPVIEELREKEKEFIGLEVKGLEGVMVEGWVKADPRDAADIEKYGSPRAAGWARMCKNYIKKMMQEDPGLVKEAVEEGPDDIQHMLGGLHDESEGIAWYYNIEHDG
jgi:hypothetical protein